MQWGGLERIFLEAPVEIAVVLIWQVYAPVISLLRYTILEGHVSSRPHRITFGGPQQSNTGAHGYRVPEIAALSRR